VKRVSYKNQVRETKASNHGEQQADGDSSNMRDEGKLRYKQRNGRTIRRRGRDGAQKWTSLRNKGVEGGGASGHIGEDVVA
jgi:hypothetical protein